MSHKLSNSRRWSREPLIYSTLSETQMTQDVQLVSEAGGRGKSFGTELLTCGVCAKTGYVRHKRLKHRAVLQFFVNINEIIDTSLVFTKNWSTAVCGKIHTSGIQKYWWVVCRENSFLLVWYSIFSFTSPKGPALNFKHCVLIFRLFYTKKEKGICL